NDPGAGGTLRTRLTGAGMDRKRPPRTQRAASRRGDESGGARRRQPAAPDCDRQGAGAGLFQPAANTALASASCLLTASVAVPPETCRASTTARAPRRLYRSSLKAGDLL